MSPVSPFFMPPDDQNGEHPCKLSLIASGFFLLFFWVIEKLQKFNDEARVNTQ